jgi:hypothetical protein
LAHGHFSDKPWRPVLKVMLPRGLPYGTTHFDPKLPPWVNQAWTLASPSSEAKTASAHFSYK